MQYFTPFLCRDNYGSSLPFLPFFFCGSTSRGRVIPGEVVELSDLGGKVVSRCLGEGSVVALGGGGASSPLGGGGKETWSDFDPVMTEGSNVSLSSS